LQLNELVVVSLAVFLSFVESFSSTGFPFSIELIDAVVFVVVAILSISSVDLFTRAVELL
jgi:hypothetical protein